MKHSFNPRRIAAGLVAALAATTIVAGCGGSSNDSPALAGTDNPEVKWVADYMHDWYLWYDRIGAAELAQSRDAEQALEAMRYRDLDRYSYIEARDRYDAFFDEGRSLGYGIAYRLETDAIRLRLVQPTSPAAAAGLRRGDLIVAIDGVPAATLIAEGRAADAFGPGTEGHVGRFTIERAGARFEVEVSKAWYEVRYVLAARVLEEVDPELGYVHLYGMAEPTRRQWREAIDTLASAGVRRLIVDLRDNGGGRLNVAAEIASSLAPAGGAGSVFVRLGFNARHQRDDYEIRLPESTLAGRFEDIVWITSGLSCSAAEMLINGLAPLRASARIGETTCGKPVGFTPTARGDKVLSAVTFAGTNRDGAGDFYAGLAPECTISEEPHLPYGDVSDPRLAEAIHRLRHGHCSARAAKSHGGWRSAARGWPWADESGLARETGLR